MILFITQTLIPKSSESSSALDCLKVFPAFVTKTTGRRNFPDSSVNRRKASFAEGRIRFPRLMTPSMSNKNPKSCPLFDCKIGKKNHFYMLIYCQNNTFGYLSWIWMVSIIDSVAVNSQHVRALTGTIIH